MKRAALSLAPCLILLASFAQTAPGQVSDELPDDATIDAIVAEAPEPPRLDPRLELKLVDFIDCADADDPLGQVFRLVEQKHAPVFVPGTTPGDDFIENGCGHAR